MSVNYKGVNKMAITKLKGNDHGDQEEADRKEKNQWVDDTELGDIHCCCWVVSTTTYEVWWLGDNLLKWIKCMAKDEGCGPRRVVVSISFNWVMRSSRPPAYSTFTMATGLLWGHRIYNKSCN